MTMTTYFIECVGEHRADALARAEEWASAHGVTYEWGEDPSDDASYRCVATLGGRTESIGGVDEVDYESYRRVIEAEAALLIESDHE